MDCLKKGMRVTDNLNGTTGKVVDPEIVLFGDMVCCLLIQWKGGKKELCPLRYLDFEEDYMMEGT